MITLIRNIMLISTILFQFSLSAVIIKNKTSHIIVLKDFCTDDSYGFPNLYEMKKLNPGQCYQEKNIISFDAVVNGQHCRFTVDETDIIVFYKVNGIITFRKQRASCCD